MSKYTILTKRDLTKVASVVAHVNEVEKSKYLSVHLMKTCVSFYLHTNDGEIQRSWHCIRACDIDATIVEVIDEITL